MISRVTLLLTDHHECHCLEHARTSTEPVGSHGSLDLLYQTGLQPERVRQGI